MAHDGPVYHRPLTEPAALRKRQSIATEPEHTDPRETLLALLSAPNNASKAWVTDQYDRYVRGTVRWPRRRRRRVLRIDEQSGRGWPSPPTATRFVELDPYSAPNWPGRGLPATSLQPGRSPGRDQLLLNPGSRRTRGDVAVLPKQ